MYIKLNGKTISTDFTHINDLKTQFLCGEHTKKIITIVDGFQSEENYPLRDGIEVTFIQKGEMPSVDVLESMMCARHTPKVHEKVKQSHVAIAGLGGLGSNVAISLARTGVGYLHLIDFDEVEPSNLNRQQYKIKHLGMPKTEALKQEIQEINPYVHVRTDNIRVDDNNIKILFLQDEIICECFDKPEAKAMLVNGILEHFPEKFMVAASGMAGYGDSNSIQTRKITSHFYMCGDGITKAEPGNGLMAPRVSVCAGHQANKVLEILIEERKIQ
ncbi:sulfur carrier protein ThiS adenylyltransferase ThiF [[Clostridium] polysaccharolyticum]|uniref:Sulfur carrier protein ThiS adenylyltransferase n=1 Tax=[Clostridium] polysaccharolyticum TaxID=29364 RepID=A0A1I0FZI1_9FIRM|nr:sulfur carrier protein ThiS adenylyltransferase ThiF [[Clostridium] polysaccharolyticum]SET63820.1 sulfur carrier protein ThiS adenylyltransferase [[Clostridium] polysaccharolyticum]